MKKGKRIAALALSMVIALGSVCYKPPKAEAFAGGMLANMCLSVYMTATGISLVPNDATAQAICSALDSLIPDFAKDYAQEVGEYTADIFRQTIEQDCIIQPTGFLQMGHIAVNLMGRFVGWLIAKYGLVSGGEAEEVVYGSPIVTKDGIQVPVINYDGKPYAYFGAGRYEFLSGFKLVSYYRPSDGCLFMEAYDNGDYKFTMGAGGDEVGFMLCLCDSPKASGHRYKGMAHVYADGSVDGWAWHVAEALNKSVGEIFGVSTTPDVTDSIEIAVDPDYETAPDVDEQYAMVINTGLTFADEQSYIDAVLNGVASGTLTPTYTIEQATTGDVVVPDEDEENNGILNWVKNIAQDVKALPRTIADAVANVFVPSEEYLAVLPETIAVTFDGRTGILTYPTSVLYDFADRLSDGQQDFILSWPDVREPSTGGVMMEAGQFNVSKFVRDNQMLSDFYVIYQYAVGAYLTFLFFGLCSRKYNSIVGDISGV